GWRGDGGGGQPARAHHDAHPGRGPAGGTIHARRRARLRAHGGRRALGDGARGAGHRTAGRRVLTRVVLPTPRSSPRRVVPSSSMTSPRESWSQAALSADRCRSKRTIRWRPDGPHPNSFARPFSSILADTTRY